MSATSKKGLTHCVIWFSIAQTLKMAYLVKNLICVTDYSQWEQRIYFRTVSSKCLMSLLKSDNFQYNTLGLLGRWDKPLINQASDVPSIIFFIISRKSHVEYSHSLLYNYRLRALKNLHFYFCKFIKKKLRK